MKNNDDFFGNGCGFIVVAPLIACICIAVGCWGYNRYGIPEIYGSLLFLVAFFLLIWCTDELADKPIKALRRRANERMRRETRRNSLLRRGIYPECEVPLETVSSTSSLGKPFTQSYEDVSGYSSRECGVIRSEARQEVRHVNQYRCTSCKQEFTDHRTSSRAIK